MPIRDNVRCYTLGIVNDSCIDEALQLMNEIEASAGAALRPGLTPDERSDARLILNAAPEAANKALDYLMDCLDETDVAGRVYARRHRLKNEEGIEEKVLRKRRDGKPEYDWTRITDIVGLRFITLYRDDIVNVADVILRALLKLITDVSPCPFKREQLVEVRLYMANASDRDPLATRFKELTTRLRKKNDKWRYKKPEHGERYSSVHFVTWFGLDKGKPLVPIEIQIRSVFEDAWGEIDHALVLEPRRREPDGDGSRNMERHSNALKKMMDAAADLGDAMRLLRSGENPPANPIRPTIDSSHYVERVCGEVGVPAPVTKRLMALISEKEELDSALANSDPKALRSDYVQIADNLKSLLSEQNAPGGFLRGKRGDARELGYVIRMEEALCRLLCFDEDQVPGSIDLLKEVTSEFPDHPVGWIRLGEAYARQMDIEPWGPTARDLARLAQEAYERTGEELEHLGKLPDRERFFAASPTQEEYIRDNLGRQHAYSIWRPASRERGGKTSDERSLAASRRALELTLVSITGVKDPEARVRLLTSMAYYAAETVEFAGSLNVDPALPRPREELRGYVEELARAARAFRGERMLQVWDTVTYAQSALDGDEAAKEAAKNVMVAHNELIGGPPRAMSRYVREQEAIAVSRALRILGIVR